MGIASGSSSIVNEYKADAFDVMHFKLIREKEDLDSDESFNPDMTHQVFGENETIFGYKDLDVTIAYMAGSLSTFIDIRYSEKIPRSISDGVEPDDIYKILKKFYTQELITSKARFLETFQEELAFKPFGQLKSGYTIKSDGKSREFAVHFVDCTSPDFEAFSSYLTRMEPFVLFFVDGSRFIDLDDRWNFYVLYEKYSSASSPNKRFAFVGYMTVYKFYTYPEHIRPRVSQLVILPPFQEMGHATRLLETVYEHLTPLPEVVDITVEDPSEDLTRLRDFLDCKRCLQLAECAEILCEKKTEVQDGAEDAPPSAKRRRQSTTVVEGQSISAATRFSDAARKQLKLSRAQSRRVYQILTFFLLVREKPDAVQAYHKALLERTRITHLLRGKVKRSVTAATGLSKMVPSPCKNLMEDVLDEQCEQELKQQVDAEVAAYEKTAEKLEAAIKAGDVDLKKLQH